ncbi:MAG: methanogen output domain 1-containing protein [Promethearchaeota archaeon]
MSKRLKKDLQVMIDEKLGQLFFGDKKKDLRLLMLRPIDLMEFSEFAGTNADDILVWVGKTLGRAYMDKFFHNKDWSSETMATKKEVILGNLEALELWGFGELTGNFRRDYILIKVADSLASEEKDNIMAKNLCLLYLGIFNAIFETLKIDVDGEETECVLLGDKHCVFKFGFIGEKLEDNLVDAEETVSEFLSTL